VKKIRRLKIKSRLILLILNKKIKISWFILVLLTFALLLLSDYNLFVFIAYTVISLFVFGFDLWKNYVTVYANSEKYKRLHAWNLMSVIGQFSFWSYLILFIFIIKDSAWYYWFIFVDLFVVSTYLNYKFKKILNTYTQ